MEAIDSPSCLVWAWLAIQLLIKTRMKMPGHVVMKDSVLTVLGT